MLRIPSWLINTFTTLNGKKSNQAFIKKLENAGFVGAFGRYNWLKKLWLLCIGEISGRILCHSGIAEGLWPAECLHIS